MRSHYILLALMTVLLAPAHSGEPPKRITLGEQLERLQSAGPRAIVTYCGREVPSLKLQLEDEYQSFVSKLTAATEPLRKRFGKKMSEPAPGDPKELDQIGNKMLEAARSYPPENYCPWMMERMKTASVESMRAVIEAQYARYEAMGKPSQGGAQK